MQRWLHTDWKAGLNHLALAQHTAMTSIQSVVEVFTDNARVSVIFGALVLILAIISRSRNTKRPPLLNDTIPYVSNTIQYLTDAGRFLDRVTYVALSCQKDLH